MKFGLDTLRQSAQIMEVCASSAEARTSWREFQNKVEAFTCFSYSDEFRADQVDAYQRLWLLEGRGYQQAETALQGETAEHDLLPLHTGMGLAFACRTMQAAADISSKTGSFLELCNKHALPGYQGACYEALGLVARNLYPEGLFACEQSLPLEIREYFWHGVGRGLYFIPTNLIPVASAPWRAVQMALREPPDQLSRLNAISGLIWAVALVNIRHPEVMDLFRFHHAGDLPASAFENGVRCALRVWDLATRSSRPDGGPPGEWFRYVDDHVYTKH